MKPHDTPPRPFGRTRFQRGSWTETVRITEILRREAVGGALLLAATIAALVWANSPGADSYHALRAYSFGPEALHLNLSLGGRPRTDCWRSSSLSLASK